MKTIAKIEKEIADTPMGVSQWMAHGKKYGYDKYFRNKAIEAVGGYKPWIGKDGLFERSVIIKVLKKLKEGRGR
jgi:hypothetical protein